MKVAMTDNPFHPGGYYHPEVDPAQLKISELYSEHISGIDLEVSRMWKFVELTQSSLTRSNVESWSDQFGSIDTSIYKGIISRFRPSRIIEVGAGASTVEASRQIVASSIDCELIAIDPFPNRTEFEVLESLDVTLLKLRVQEVKSELFQQLQPNDILFVDTSHCAKTGSDVLDIFFRVLPTLAPGVLIHVHDIFYPFEYPFEWIFGQTRSWNEIYFLRALLSYHSTLRVQLFNDLLYQSDPTRLRSLLGVHSGGRPGSIWLVNEQN